MGRDLDENRDGNRDNKALETIAEELSRIRALKEYELRVISTTTEGYEEDGIWLVAGENNYSESDRRTHGDNVWHEDRGRVNRDGRVPHS